MSDTASSALTALTERYRASLPGKRAAISAAARDWRAAPGDRERLHALDQPLHKLAGSAGAYGFVRLGEAARQADGLIADALAASTESATTASAPLRQLFSVLREIDELFDSEIGGSSDVGNACACTGTGACVASASGLQVLLVDDDVELAAVLYEQLGREGIQVSVVHDGAAMHRALAARRPDVLLLDYWLQAETGAELASSVHALADYADLPTLCLTTDHSEHTRQCALAAGVLAMVDKSLPSAELAIKLRQLAQRAA